MGSNEQNNDSGAKFFAMSVIAIPFGILGGLEMDFGITGTIGVIIALYLICALFMND